MFVPGEKILRFKDENFFTFSIERTGGLSRISKVKKFPLIRIPISGIGLVLCIPATVFLLDHDETEVCVLEESMRVIIR